MTISTTPAQPAAGAAVSIASSLTGDNLAAVAITSIPAGSKVPLGLLTTASDKPSASATDAVARRLAVASFTPDVAGPYGVIVYIVRHLPGLPTFLGDTAGDERFDLVASDSGTVHVAGDLDLPIATVHGDGASLRLRILDETVIAASLVDATTAKARVAIDDASVVAALAALVGQAVTAIGPVVETTATELRTMYETHRVLLAGVHAAADTNNTVARTEANSIEGAIELAAALHAALVGHLKTGSANSPDWHKDARGEAHDDLKNLPLTAPPTTLAQLVVSLADLRYRVYERHRVQVASPAPHGAADNVNALAPPTLLDAVIVAFLGAIAAEDPTVPAAKPAGIVRAVHLYGFGPPPGASPPDIAPAPISPPDI